MSEQNEIVNGWTLSKIPEGFVFEWKAVSADKKFEDKFYSHQAAVEFAETHDPKTYQEITTAGMSPK